MLYSCARRAYLCEALIDQLAQRPPLPAVRNLLSAGLCALCDFPQKSYAILNEAVTAAKADPETAPAAGFINACLRRFTREAEKLTDFVNRDPCVRFNAPRWWIERLDREFGRAAADEILAVQKKKPPLTVRVNRRRTTVSAWCETARSQGLTVAAVENEAVVINGPCLSEKFRALTKGSSAFRMPAHSLPRIFWRLKTETGYWTRALHPAAKQHIFWNWLIAQ